MTQMDEYWHHGTENMVIINDIQTSAQRWSNLCNLTGGCLALHKYEWRLIAWEWHNNDWRLLQTVDDELVLEDGNGAYAIIKFCGPDEPNKGLDFHICPIGKQKHQFEAIREKVQEVCGAIQSAHLTENEARQALFQRIVPKLSYPLHLNANPKRRGLATSTNIGRGLALLLELPKCAHFQA